MAPNISSLRAQAPAGGISKAGTKKVDRNAWYLTNWAGKKKRARLHFEVGDHFEFALTGHHMRTLIDVEFCCEKENNSLFLSAKKYPLKRRPTAGFLVQTARLR